MAHLEFPIAGCDVGMRGNDLGALDFENGIRWEVVANGKKLGF